MACGRWMIFMSPALSMKVPPLIWNPEAEVKSGMGEAKRVGDTSLAKKLL
jgi:hypothetical protein